MGKAIGIDLGTTNSCAAVIEGKTPRIITDPTGAKTIPSVFAVDSAGRTLIGTEAQDQASQNPHNTVIASKRLIGRTFGSANIQKMAQVFTYEIMGGDDSEVLVKVAGQVFTLEQISSAILERIKVNAEAALGEPVDAAVITVPAYFNDRQRQAVRNAGRLAGLEVLRVLNEPTAAALAYGLGRTLNQRVAIYDLGGGTFDISIINIKDKIFEVIATGGDTFLGGVDFDDRIMQHVLKKFLTDYDVDLSYDRGAISRIRSASEKAKIALSEKLEAEIELEKIWTDTDGTTIDLRLTITRDKLQELTIDLVNRSLDTCRRILREAGSSQHDIDEMLLVGGQSRMPLVRSKIHGFLGRPPSRKVHPDEAVAIGAAIMAKSLGSKRTADDVTLLDVLPMAIGISKVDGTMHVLFPKNQPLPNYKARTLTTSKANQKSIMLRIYQGESNYVAENELLGTFVFSGLREAPKGDVKIEVTFHIDAEGILNLSARDKTTNEVVDATLKLEKQAAPTTKTRRKSKKKELSPPPISSPTPLKVPKASLGPDPNSTEPVNGHGHAKAPATPAGAPKPPPGDGVMGRIGSWFKGLFGG